MSFGDRDGSCIFDPGHFLRADVVGMVRDSGAVAVVAMASCRRRRSTVPRVSESVCRILWYLSSTAAEVYCYGVIPVSQGRCRGRDHRLPSSGVSRLRIQYHQIGSRDRIGDAGVTLASHSSLVPTRRRIGCGPDSSCSGGSRDVRRRSEMQLTSLSILSWTGEMGP